MKLLRSLPPRFKVDVRIRPGTHASELAVNKQASLDDYFFENTVGLLTIKDFIFWRVDWNFVVTAHVKVVRIRFERVF